MTRKKNCWEVKKCERQPGGAKVEELGVCSSAVPGNFEGINHGTHGGRFCWRIAGTLCGGKPQGTAAQKTFNCLNCDFFKQVVKEESPNFMLSPADFPINMKSDQNNQDLCSETEPEQQVNAIKK